MICVLFEKDMFIFSQNRDIRCWFITQYSYSNIMSKRVTIMIDDDLDKKIRQRQAKMIQQKQTSYSYSKTLNEILRKNL